MRAATAEMEAAPRNPIRETFVDCCVSAMTATASNTTEKRIDGTAALFITHLVSSVIYHADRDKGKCDLRAERRQGLVEWEGRISPKIELNDATVAFCGIKSTRQELEERMDELARKYVETDEKEIVEELYRLARELEKMEKKSLD
jgi:hypothetical protein